MINGQDIKKLEDLSEQFSTWIFKYHSENFAKPLFLIWYRDNDFNKTEKILTYKNGSFFTATSLIELKEKLYTERNELIAPNHIHLWLTAIKEIKAVESINYNLASVITDLEKGILEEKTIEGFAEFINLFDDFIHQDKKNNHLQIYIDNGLIREAWEYYYEFIFWPRFNDQEKYDSWDRPKLEINIPKLVEEFKNVILKFEESIKVTI
ncbi:hypothetical protein DS884_00075 [Tenacibaculum sp. E3R01]|uniref:hypothetical protein n=1 Tax=Tenacibaculum sp. E3R01 TaxID=2267227 RepID=UPI000DE82113|nr:hypothetical protein [Tenacibaculum sp. E3R01]RBW63421.1 hypothetical protein DS884_00075 [Tenacibaculum sp. E3R01]